MMKTRTKLWLAIACCAAASPLGLYIPAKLKSGAAWGEWSSGELKNLVGFVPDGLHKLSGLWNAPFPNYGLPDSAHTGGAYIVSAIVGVILCAGIAFLIGRILSGKRK